MHSEKYKMHKVLNVIILRENNLNNNNTQTLNIVLKDLAEFTFWLTPRSRVLLEKLTGSQLVKKFPAIYRTRRFITSFTRARHLFLS